MKAAPKPDLIHGITAISEYLGIPRSSLRRLLSLGEVPVFRMGDGKTIYARPSKLDAYRVSAEARLKAEAAFKESIAQSRKQAIIALPPRRARPSGSLRRICWNARSGARYAWAVRWKDEFGSHRSRQFAAKADAEEFRDRIRGASGTSYEPIGNEVTVKYAALEYLKWYREKLRDGRVTQETYAGVYSDVKRSVIAPIGQYRLNELSLHTLSRWHQMLRHERKLNPAVARDKVARLKAILEFAQRREWTTRNKAADLMVELRGIPSTRIRSFLFAEIRQLLAAAEDRSTIERERTWLLSRIYIHLASFCGLRWGEITALSPDHIDLSNRVIHIRRNITSAGRIKTPKTKAGIRDVPLPRHICAMITEWRNKYVHKNKLNLLFTSNSGTAICQTAFHKYYWRPVLVAARLDNGKSFHFHALRHFAASWMVKNGLPLTDVAAIMGHTRVDMTLDVYAHALEENGAHGPTMQALTDQILISAALPVDHPGAPL